MKSYLSIAIFLFLNNVTFAQFNNIRLSPTQTIEQRVGLTDVSIKYSRPQMRGRVIFGDLVPYGEMWRTGANRNTKITFSHRVKIDDQEIEKGSYSLFTVPEKDQWEIYFYKDVDQYGIPEEIDDNKLIFLTKVPALNSAKKNESLVINIYNIMDDDKDTADLGISWEHTEVYVPIKFFTHEVMEEQILKAKGEGASRFEVSAAYYNDRNIELEKAKELIEEAIALQAKPRPTTFNIYGRVLYKLGEKEKAIEAIEYSLKLAKEWEYYTTAKQNEDLLEKWKQ